MQIYQSLIVCDGIRFFSQDVFNKLSTPPNVLCSVFVISQQSIQERGEKIPLISLLVCEGGRKAAIMGKYMNNLLSIVVTTYNREKTIGRTLDSLLSQSYKNIEIIVVDDCSKDNTIEVIKSYKDPRIKIYENKKNLGVAKNKYEAYKYVTGSYYTYLDSDDYYIDDNFFENAIRIFGEYDVNLYISSATYVGACKRIVYPCFTGLLPVKDYINEYQKKYQRSLNGAMIIKKSSFDNWKEFGEIKLFDDALMYLGGIGTSGYVYGSSNIVLANEQQTNSVSYHISKDLIKCHLVGTVSLFNYYKSFGLIVHDEEWIFYQLKALLYFYMSSPNAAINDIIYTNKLLKMLNVNNRFGLIKSMLGDFIYIKIKNRK